MSKQAQTVRRGYTPKRRIRQNIYGNWYGYEGTRKVEMFFGNSWEQEKAAREWLVGLRASECSLACPECERSHGPHYKGRCDHE